MIIWNLLIVISSLCFENIKNDHKSSKYIYLNIYINKYILLRCVGFGFIPDNYGSSGSSDYLNMLAVIACDWSIKEFHLRF